MTALRTRLLSWLTRAPRADKGKARKSKARKSKTSQGTNGQFKESVAKAIVVCTPTADKGRSHRLCSELDDQLIIGRNHDCDVVLDDGYSAEQHARLFLRDEQHLLEDLDSVNGTYVNRQRIRSEIVLHPGDQIQIGTTVFEVTS